MGVLPFCFSRIHSTAPGVNGFRPHALFAVRGIQRRRSNRRDCVVDRRRSCSYRWNATDQGRRGVRRKNRWQARERAANDYLLVGDAFGLGAAGRRITCGQVSTTAISPPSPFDTYAILSVPERPMEIAPSKRVS